MVKTERINKLIAYYQMMGCVLALLFLLDISFIRFSHFLILGLLVFTFFASYKLLKRGEKKLFIWAQLIQVLGVSVSGFVFSGTNFSAFNFHLHAGPFLGPIIGAIHEKVIWGFTFEAPSGVSDFSEDIRDYAFFSFNLIPCAILLYFYYIDKKDDIIY